jgi:hypothetical protein
MFSVRLSVAVLLLYPCLAYGQVNPFGKDASAAVTRSDPGVQETREMYENIEIMRRILSERLQAWTMSCVQCHVGRNADKLAFSPDGKVLVTGEQMVRIWDAKTGKSMSSQATRIEVDGFYLRGQGVVLSASLPASLQFGHAALDFKSDVKPLSEWERTRKGLLGEPTPDMAVPNVAETNPADVILRALAENGNHFSGLKAEENITVVIAFRWPGNVHSYGTVVRTTTRVHAAAAGLSGPDARDPILLGDLHLKQGRSKDAIKAYKDAIQRFQGDPTNPMLADIGRKLAQALLADDQVDQATKLLENLSKLKKGSTGSRPLVGKATLAGRIPHRLLVSVTKDLADRVAGGRMNFAEFRRAARVEDIQFSSASPSVPSERKESK